MPAEKNVEWRLVPTQPTPEIDAEGESVREFGASAVYAAMVENAPQPPALGGEPVAWMYKRHDQSPHGKPCQHIAISSENLTEVREGLKGIGIPSDNHFDWQPLGYVAPLLAEIERLNKACSDNFANTQRVAQERNRVSAHRGEIIAERDTLKEQLEKARDLLQEAGGKLYVDTQLKLRIQHFITQAAPAAKDGAQ